MSVRSISTYMTVGTVAQGAPHPSVVSANLKYAGEAALPQAKCVVTVGPACNDAEKLGALIQAGATGFRFNMSHVLDDKALTATLRTVLLLRYQAARLGRQVAILADMKGSEFRVRAEQPLELNPGERVCFSTEPGQSLKRDDRIVLHISSPRGYDLIRDLLRNKETFAKGKPPFVFMDDGNIAIELENWPEVFDQESPNTRFWGTIRYGGTLKPNKGVNFPGFSLGHLPGMTQEDHYVVTKIFDRDFVAEAWETFADDQPEIAKMVAQANIQGAFHLLGFDYVAPSFVRDPKNLGEFDDVLNRIFAQHVLLIPKIETREAVQPEILKALMLHRRTVGAMVARGDLAVEAGFESVPLHQSLIHGTAMAAARFSILATDVMGSMTDGKLPHAKRGEYGDLFRSLQEGAHAIMLSEETATGKDPLYVVRHLLETMGHDRMEPAISNSQIRKTQQARIMEMREHGFHEMFKGPQATAETLEQADLYNDLARTILRVENYPFVGGLVLWSHRGESMRSAAQILPSYPIYVVTDDPRVAREGAITRGIFPILVKEKPRDGAELEKIVEAAVTVPPRQESARLKVMHNLGT